MITPAISQMEFIRVAGREEQGTGGGGGGKQKVGKTIHRDENSSTVSS